ncbi:MAG: hypothetical protein E2O52_03670 [Gammaproteobacteria bacterium]|nr:MAG: hypothetical protein E2O52_03670 [Gammaproteobacteria bacterium]
MPTDDIQASLEFYQRLDFTELNVNDVRTHYYAVVTDGRIAVGLHAEGCMSRPCHLFCRIS